MKMSKEDEERFWREEQENLNDFCRREQEAIDRAQALDEVKQVYLSARQAGGQEAADQAVREFLRRKRQEQGESKPDERSE